MDTEAPSFGSMPRIRNKPAALLAMVIAVGCASPAEQAPFSLPGDRVFPEGIACDHATGDIFVGSTDDGAIYRGNVDEPGELEVFLEPGVDGREAVTGLKVDDAGRLFVAGRDSGRVYVYDVGSGELLRSYETVTDGSDALINDITFADGGAYVTDSFRPVIYRVPVTSSELGEIEPWLELSSSRIPYEDEFNLNGITSSDDGRYLVTVHAGTGVLYRIDTTTQEIVEIDLGDRDLASGDGLLLDGRTLFAVVTSPEAQVIQLDVAADLTSATVVEEIVDESFAYPTTLAQCGTDRIQVVNSQLDEAPDGDPALPFTISEIEVEIG